MLRPVMGVYLDAVNDAKANAASGTKPNENLARELLQLFSIGTARLEPDGRRISPTTSRCRPTTRPSCKRSRASLPAGPTRRTRRSDPMAESPDLIAPMVAVDAEHNQGTKKSLAISHCQHSRAQHQDSNRLWTRWPPIPTSHRSSAGA